MKKIQDKEGRFVVATCNLEGGGGGTMAGIDRQKFSSIGQLISLELPQRSPKAETARDRAAQHTFPRQNPLVLPPEVLFSLHCVEVGL